MNFQYLVSQIRFVGICLLGFFILSANVANADGPRSPALVTASGNLTIGMDIPYGVMEFYDDNGTPAGIDVDIAREIATALEVTADFKAMPFDELFTAINSNTVDLVLSAVTITAERQKEMLFSAPYLSASTVVAVSKSNDSVSSIADLAGGTIGVLKGTLGEKLVAESDALSALEARQYTNNDERIKDLVEGRLDSAVVHFLVRTDLPVRIIGEPITQNYYGVVANLQNTSLMSEVDKVLRGMKRSGRLDEIIKSYTD